MNTANFLNLSHLVLIFLGKDTDYIATRIPPQHSALCMLNTTHISGSTMWI